MKALLIAINSKYIHTALGIRSICAYCRQQGQQIDCLEETIQTPILAVLSSITASGAQVIGFDVHIWNRTYVMKLVALVRQVLPEAIICLGGPEVSFTPELALRSCPAAQYIIQGEGEEVFAQLLQALTQQDVNIPPHVSYRYNGKLILSTPAYVENLDDLPFPYDDLPLLVAEHKMVYYESSRGCPFHCSYCLSGISHRVRKRSPHLVMKELDAMAAAGIDLVKFVDRTYNLDENYYLPILRHLAGQKEKICYHLEVKADLLSEEALRFFSTAPQGRFQMEIGVQTTNPQTLAAIGRQDNWSKLSSNVQELVRVGKEHIHLDLIAGLPYENFLSFWVSFNDVYALKPQMLQLGFLKVLPGSLMSKQTQEHKLLYMQDEPYEILATKYLSYEELRFLKVLEDVFDHTYNTGKFSHTLAYLVENIAQGDAFKFYTHLTNWWIEHKLYPQAHSVKNMVLLLLEYAQDNLLQVEEFKEILKFDVFMGLPNYRPSALPWHNQELREQINIFWKNKALGKYVVDYQFSTWNNVRKYMPLELFKWQPSMGYGMDYYIMADYRNDQGNYYIIDKKDLEE